MDRVSHVQFVELLSEKLGMSEEETVKKLTELTIHIKEKAASGDVVIDGLGTFSTINKKLAFAPDESFELEVNQNYAGMLPVTIDDPKPAKETAVKADDDDTVKAVEGKEEETRKAAGDEPGPDEAGAFEEEEFVDVIGEEDPFDLDEEDPFDLDEEEPKPSGKKKAAAKDGEAETAAEKARQAAAAEEDKKKREADEETEEAEALVAAVLAKKSAEELTSAETVSETAETGSDNPVEPAAETDKKSTKTADTKTAAGITSTQADAQQPEKTEASAESSADDGIKPEWVEGSNEVKSGDVSDGKKPDAGKDKSVKAVPDKDGKKPKTKDLPAFDRNRPDSNTGTIVAILLAAVVIIAAALYFFGLMPGSRSDTTDPVITEEQQVPPAQQPTVMPDPAETTPEFREGEQLADQEAAADVTSQPGQTAGDQAADAVQTPAEDSTPPSDAPATAAPTAQQTISAAPASAFGLRGTMDTSLLRPYTIVVHSLNSRSDAQREASSLAGAGYRSTFYQVQLPTGESRWRVAIGQFRSSNAAVEASQNLPEPYLNNNFISRIESYNP
jgi:hypothetical protein